MDWQFALMVSIISFISMAMARIKCQSTRDSTQLFFLFWIEESCSPLPMSGVAVKAVEYAKRRRGSKRNRRRLKFLWLAQNFWFRVGEQPQTCFQWKVGPLEGFSWVL
jgi:hypothetical protein